jgi:hypothetical protein
MTTPSNEIHLVFLIHGIRTRAAWVPRVTGAIETDGFRVCPCSYGYFDLFRFWLPGGTREVPVALIERQIRAYKNTYEKKGTAVRMSAIAHSFGTYIVSRILEEATDLRWERLILCGAIVPEDFRWDRVEGQVQAANVINDVGRRDIWPAMAKVLTFGYGDSGTAGFYSAVENRFHNCGHGDYFEGSFPNDFWAPWIHSGTLRKPEGVVGESAIPGWLGIRGLRIIGFAVVALLLLSLVLLVLSLPFALFTRTWWLVYLFAATGALGIAYRLPRWWHRVGCVAAVTALAIGARLWLGPSRYYVDPKYFGELQANGNWDSDGNLGLELRGVPNEVALAPNRLRIDVVQGKMEENIRADQPQTIPKWVTIPKVVRRLRKGAPVTVRVRVRDPFEVTIFARDLPIEFGGVKP